MATLIPSLRAKAVGVFTPVAFTGAYMLWRAHDQRASTAGRPWSITAKDRFAVASGIDIDDVLFVDSKRAEERGVSSFFSRVLSRTGDQEWYPH